jgi:hypothetical protein
LLIALLPTPITRILLRGRRRLEIESKFSETGRRRAGLAAVALFVTAVDLILVTSLFTAGLAKKQLSGTDPSPYVIQNDSLECTVEKQGEETRIKSIMIVTVTGKQPWLFSRDDFSFFLSAERTKADPAANPKLALVTHQDPKRIGRGQIPAAFALPTASDRLLVEPGRSAAIDLEAKLDAAHFAFLSEHPKEQRCTVSSIVKDYPVGAAAPLVDRTAAEIDPPKAGAQN